MTSSRLRHAISAANALRGPQHGLVVAEALPHASSASSIAIVGLACRFPDADDPATLLDAVLTGRRAFRRLPPSRMELNGLAAAAAPAELAAAGLATTARAALIEGWRFDRDAFRIPPPAYAADPAYLLALETAARALAAAGFPGGTGLDRDRIGIIIGHAPVSGYLVGGSLGSPATLASIPADGSPGRRSQASLSAASPSAASLSAASPTLASSSLRSGAGDDAVHAPIAARISSYFGFRGGGHCVDGGTASALQAVTSACAALLAADMDVALAGGVDVSLGHAWAGRRSRAGSGAANGAASGDRSVRIYDEDPTGCLPGEGCGVVVLMRTADARAAGLPVYAEIIGSGTSAGAAASSVSSDAGSQLLALSRAYERAGIDPADIQLIEGSGSAVAAADEAELTALGMLRRHTRKQAALGSVTANMGHANAAAGAAGLIKVVLALGSGIVPPTTGVRRPHLLLRGGDANLRLPDAAADWPGGHRLAGVSAMGAGGINVHLVLRNQPGSGSRQDRLLRVLPRPGRPEPGAGRSLVSCPVDDGAERPAAYLLHAPDRRQLAGQLARIAELAGWLSDAEMRDLAWQLAGDAVKQGPVRAGIVATRQDELARQARTASSLLPGLRDGVLASQPGVFTADGADGRVTLLFSDVAAAAAADLAERQPAPTASRRSCSAAQASSAAGASGPQWSAALSAALDTLRWLETLDVHATAGVGHGFGEIAGLIWAGVLSQDDAAEVAALRAELLRGPVAAAAGHGRHAGRHHARASVDAVPRDERALLRAATAHLHFGPPCRRLISASTGTELARPDQVIDVICAGLAGAARLADALAIGAVGANLLLEAGPPGLLAAAAVGRSRVPAISAGSGHGEAGPGPHDESALVASAALFAAGALGRPQALYSGQPARPIDIWRERIFIAAPQPASGNEPAGRPAGAQGIAPPDARAVAGPRPQAGASPSAAGLRTLLEVSRQTSDPGPSRPTSPEQAPGAPRHGLRRREPGQVRPGWLAAASSVAGAGPWVRCFAEQLREPSRPARHADDGPWQVRAPGRSPFGVEVSELFRDDAGARRTLAIIGDPADAGTCEEALGAARDAIRTGRLVVITSSAGLDGFWATLHAEHPALGVTVLRTPGSPAGLRAAARLADAEPGEFRQLVLDAAGRVHEPVMTPIAGPAGGRFPLGPDDVVLVTRQAGGAGLALAQVMALSGAPVAVIGREPRDADTEVVAGLEQLRSAGARVAYEVADIADPAALAAAVRRIEDRLGPVTALGHAVGTLPALPVSELTDAAIRGHLADQTAVLRQLLTSVTAGRLRLIATFGSVAARYGLARDGMLAVASAALAEQAERAAAAVPGCRSLHIDWPGWPGTAAGQPHGTARALAGAGVEPVSVSAASRLLLKLLAAPELPARLAVHGRVGIPAPDLIGAPAAVATAGRFVDQIVAHYPGIELVCQARLSLHSDPYLADYRIDGMPVLPPVMALEALAQAASVLAGRAVRQAARIVMAAPVVLPDGPGDSDALIRICALRDGNTVTAVLRCEDSGFGVEHARAEFCVDAEEAAAAADGTPLVTALSPGQSGLVDGAELYGPICFQSGRFRRVAILPEVTSLSCRALARGTDDQPWFAAETGPGAGLVLGSPGLNDATLHMLQACVPHRRLGLASCESVTFSGRIPDGAVEIRATAAAQDRPAAPSTPASLTAAGAAGSTAAGAAGSTAALATAVTAPNGDRGGAARPAAVIPAQRPAAGSSPPAYAAQSEPAGPLWDIEAVDASGHCLVHWRGAHMRDSGPLPRNAAWPPSLLSAYLEHGARALGLDPGLTVSIQCGEPDDSRLTRTRPADLPAAGVITLPSQRKPPDAAAAGPAAESARRTAIADSAGQLAGFTLTVASDAAVACGWAVTEAEHRAEAGTGPGRATAYGQLRQLAAEPPAASAARLQAVAACLAVAGAPPGCPVSVERVTSEGWALLDAGGAWMASTVVELSGVSRPVAVAILTGAPLAEPGGPGQDRPRGRIRGFRAAARS